MGLSDWALFVALGAVVAVVWGVAVFVYMGLT
jgi:hypothetical protein